MKVRVKLYDDMKPYAPEGQAEFHLSLAPGATLSRLHDKLQIPPNSTHTVLVNGRRQPLSTPLNPGDTIVMFPQLCGG